MIPLYPPRQGDPSLRLVKWRSLVQLVHHSHDEEQADSDENRPRIRSLSTIVFLPNSRKHSSSSNHNLAVRKKSESAIGTSSSSLERRRPSAPSLTDLRRFLPNIIHRTKSSSSIKDEEDAELLISGSKGWKRIG